MSDLKAPHIEHRVIGEKSYELEHAPGVDCYDRLEGTVHSKADADSLVEYLRSKGYMVKVIRVSHTYVVDDEFESDAHMGHEKSDA